MPDATTTDPAVPRTPSGPLMERLCWAVELERELQSGTVAHGYAAGHVAGIAEVAGMLLDEDPVDLIREAREIVGAK